MLDNIQGQFEISQIFHLSLIEQDSIKEGKINRLNKLLKPKQVLNARDKKITQNRSNLQYNLTKSSVTKPLYYIYPLKLDLYLNQMDSSIPTIAKSTGLPTNVYYIVKRIIYQEISCVT